MVAKKQSKSIAKKISKFSRLHVALFWGFAFVLLMALLMAFNNGLLHNIFASGKTYFVSPNGNDSNSGSSLLPFKTISKALSVVTAGDVVYVASGTYAPVTISKSGTTGLPIVIKGDMAKITGGAIGMNISGSNLDISGFDVSGSVSHTVLISGKNIKFANFLVHDGVNENKSGGICVNNQWGSGLKVMLGGENVLIENGKIYQSCGEGLAVTRAVGVTISNVISYDNYSANFYLDNSRNVTLKNSFAYCTTNTAFYRNGKPAAGILIGEESYTGWGAQLANLSVVNNIIYKCSGLSFYGAEVSPGGLEGALIANNTIWGVYGGGRAVNISAQPKNTNIRIVNNIAAGSISTGTGITSSNNLATATFAITPSYDPNSFKLSAGSIAVNSGVSVGVTTDYLGATRDSRPDIGAFEYGGIVTNPTPSTVTVTPTISATPTPTSTPKPTVSATPTPTSTPKPTVSATPTPTIISGSDTTPPVVTVKSPKVNSAVKNSVYIGSTAKDSSGISSFEYYFDSKLVKVCSNQNYCDYTYNTSSVAVGPHSITMNVFDKSSNKNKAVVVIPVTK